MPTLTSSNPSRLSLQLRHAQYDVLVGSKLIPRAGEFIRSESNISAERFAIVTDSNVAPLYLEQVVASLDACGLDTVEIIVPAGEESKCLKKVTEVSCRMLQAGLDRKSALIALGGGVVGDLAGFVAAIFQRGIPYVQIPTTIVSQVDSSVGGKTGVNTPEGKNLLGAFHQPELVLADIDSLASLPEREFNEGFAEIIKHAAIRDSALLDLCEDLDSIRENLIPLITHNVMIKGTVVEEDEKETKGARALLNFGHTIGHGIEAAGGYGRFLHGEAISLGLTAALRLSVELAGLDEADAERVIRLLQQYELPTSLARDIPKEKILEAMQRDKKFEDGQIRYVLLDELGSAFVSKEVTLEQIDSAIEDLYS